MLQISNLEEIRNIDQNIREVLGPGSVVGYTVEPVPSGVPVLLLYEEGILTAAHTRGDLYGNEDVTRNVKTILTVPLSIHSILARKEPPGRLGVWGVVYIEKDAAAKLDAPYGSMRDVVSASLIGADVKVTARCPLNIFCYGAEREFEMSRHLGVETHFEIMQIVQSWGFRVNKPHIRLCSGISEVINAIRLIEEQSGSSSYELNGAMVQLNLLTQRSAIETKLHHDGVMAYEFR